MVDQALHVAFRAPGLPPAPPPELDPDLDAAARCFVRYGVSRTSVPDVARELGVSRTTVYRRLGPVDAIVRLLFARELHRLLELLAGEAEAARHGRALGPETLVELVAMVVDWCREHPVMRKVLADEPELVGSLAEGFPEIVTRVSPVATPVLRWAMDEGLLACRDAERVAEWLVRITISAMLAPPPGDLRAFLAELLLPALDPPGR